MCLNSQLAILGVCAGKLCQHFPVLGSYTSIFCAGKFFEASWLQNQTRSKPFVVLTCRNLLVVATLLSWFGLVQGGWQEGYLFVTIK